MADIFNAVLNNLDCFVLTFIRVTALLISSPIFGRRNVPRVAQIGLCLCISYIVFTAYPPGPLAIPGVVAFALMCLKELLFGLIMGFVTTLFFTLVYTAGHIIDMEIGFGMVNIFDVESNISAPVSGTLLNITMILVFFAVDGHLQLIYVLVATFRGIPPGMVQVDLTMAMVALEVFISAFVLAVNVALPFICAGLMTEIVLGFIVRMTPQMNIFVVGMPLKVLMGLAVLLAIVPVFSNFTNSLFSEMFYAIDYMFGRLVSAA